MRTSVRRQVYRAPVTTSTPGLQGDPGQSAYQLWLQQGHTGTVDDFLAAMKGEPGTDGETMPADHGEDGAPGKSAYELAQEEGFTGTLAEWLTSLRGRDGDDGKDSTVPGPASTVPGPSAYDVWVAAGHTGSPADFLAALKGKDGTDGKNATPPVVAWGDHLLALQLLGGASRTVTIALNKAMPSANYAVVPSVLGWGLSVESATPIDATKVSVVLKNNLLTALLSGAVGARVVAIG